MAGGRGPGKKTADNVAGNLINALQAATTKVETPKTPSKVVVAGTADGRVKAAYVGSTKRSDKIMLYMGCCIDNSGSMEASCGSGKTRLQVALECMQRLCESDMVLNHDSMTVHTFNVDVIFRLSCPMKRYDYSRMVSDIKKKPGDAGGTRIWDGMLTTFQTMKKHEEQEKYGKKVVRYMLVFTDGGDTNSKTKLEDLAASMARPGLADFHLIVVAAGVTGATDTARLQQLCSPAHCKLISVSSASELDIQNAFEQAMVYVRKLLVQVGKETGMIELQGTKQQAHDLDKKVLTAFQASGLQPQLPGSKATPLLKHISDAGSDSKGKASKPNKPKPPKQQANDKADLDAILKAFAKG